MLGVMIAHARGNLPILKRDLHLEVIDQSRRKLQSGGFKSTSHSSEALKSN